MKSTNVHILKSALSHIFTVVNKSTQKLVLLQKNTFLHKKLLVVVNTNTAMSNPNGLLSQKVCRYLD